MSYIYIYILNFLAWGRVGLYSCLCVLQQLAVCSVNVRFEASHLKRLQKHFGGIWRFMDPYFVIYDIWYIYIYKHITPSSFPKRTKNAIMIKRSVIFAWVLTSEAEVRIHAKIKDLSTIIAFWDGCVGHKKDELWLRGLWFSMDSDFCCRVQNPCKNQGPLNHNSTFWMAASLEKPFCGAWSAFKKWIMAERSLIFTWILTSVGESESMQKSRTS